MKKIHLLSAMAVLLLIFSGCKKDSSHNTSGSLIFSSGLITTISNPDTTIYNITSGELNVNGNGVYATTALSGNSVLNISILGQIISGANTINSSSNSLQVVITTNKGGVVTDYDNVSGVLNLSGTNLAFDLQIYPTANPSDINTVTGTVKY